MGRSIMFLLGCVVLLGAQAWARQIMGKTNLGSFGPGLVILEVKLELNDPSGDQVLGGNEKGALKVVISNIGGSIAEGVRVSLTSTPQLKGVTFPSELAAGNVEPGKSKEVVFEFETDSSIISQTVDLTVRAITAVGITTDPKILKLVTRKKAKVPVLLAKAEFVEPSGNNLLDAGETGSIRLIVKNVGNAPAKSVLAKLVKTDQISDVIATQSISVEDIPAGATITGLFQVSASENVSERIVKFTVEVSSSSTDSVARSSVEVTTTNWILAKDVTPPTIEILEPADFVKRGMKIPGGQPFVTTSSSFMLKGVAKDSSGVARVLINGRETAFASTGSGAEFVSTVLLAMGDNETLIRAVDRFGNEQTLKLLTRREEERIGGKHYALLIAVDQYDQWARLSNPVNDTRAVAGELSRSYGFITEVLENAERDQILSTLRKYAEKKYEEHDQLLIYFAGHGQFDEVLGDGYLVARDSKLRDDIKTSYISHSNLRTMVNNIPNRHIFLVVDACFGGTFDPLIAANLRGEDEYKEVTKTEFIQRKMKFRTRRYLTSGGKEYVPDGRPGQHSPFTRRFLEALRSYGGRDGILTMNEILGYVEKVKPEPRAGEFGINEPGSDFVFIAR